MCVVFHYSKMKKTEETDSVPTSISWRQILILLAVYLNVFMMGCKLAWTPFAIYFFNKGDEVSNTPKEAALIASSGEIARLLMIIPAGLLVDKIGRKKIIIAAAVFDFCSLLGLSLGTSFIAIYIARFISGISTALVNSTAMISIGELASPNVRGKLTAFYQQAFIWGNGFQIVIFLLFSSYFIQSYCTLAVCCLNCIFLFWAIETPNYLISVSKHEKALKNLKLVRNGFSENEINSEFKNLKNYIEDEKKRKTDSSWMNFMKSKEIRKPLITSFLINFFGMGIGCYPIVTYVIMLLPKNELISTEYYPLVHFCFRMVAGFILPLYIEKLPRRLLFMLGTLFTSLSLFILAIVYFSYIEYDNSTCKWIFIFGVIISEMVAAGSVLPMISILKTEILPHSVKGFGGSLCVIAQSMMNAILILIFNWIVEHFGLCYNYLLYAVNGFVLIFLIYYLVPESRGKFLADIQMEINIKSEHAGIAGNTTKSDEK